MLAYDVVITCTVCKFTEHLLTHPAYSQLQTQLLSINSTYRFYV